MNKKRILLTSIISVIAMLSCTVAISFAWFVTKNNILLNEENGIDGVVKKKYFHRGDGSEEDPFVITTAKHYENLVELTNNTNDFWHAYKDPDGDGHYTGFYFSIGCRKGAFDDPEKPISEIVEPAGDTNFYIYDVGDDGVIKKDASGNEKVISSNDPSPALNLMCLKDQGGIVPLGTAARPFVGTLSGNKFIIKNYKVTSYDYYNKDYCGDVGVFGFVGFNGHCDSLYFDELEIDTSYAKIKESSEHTHHSKTEQEGLEDATVGIGYIAGHIVNSGNFTNVYVNNCDITGQTGSSDKQRSTFGYYGIVENDYLGGKIGEGHNYDFMLDSKNVYDYFDNNYANIKDEPFRSRNTEYHAPGAEHDPREDHGLDSQGQATHPFSDAVYKYSNRQYNILGDSPEDDDEDYRKDAHNYSLSTMGYIGTTTATEPEEYEVFYQDSSGNYVSPNEDMVLDTKEDFPEYDTVGLASSYREGYYYYLNSSESAWKYYYSNNWYDDSTVSVTFNYSNTFSEISMGRFTFYTQTSYLKSGTNKAYLIIDNQIVDTITYTAKVDTRTEGLAIRGIYVNNIKLSRSSFTTNLKRGTHYCALVLGIQCARDDANYSMYGLLYSGGVSASRNGNDYNITNYQSFTVNQSNNNVSLSLNQKNTSGSINETDSIIIYAKSPQQVFNNQIPPFIGTGTWSSEKVLYGKLTSNPSAPVISLPAYADFSFRKEAYQSSSSSETLYRWFAQTKPARTIPEGATPTYVGDDKTYIQKADDLGRKYVPDNIDIVGGGIKFYYFAYHGIFLDFEIKIIRIESEGPNDKLVKVPKAGDIGKPFYATKYCPNSIVLYLKNTGNSADEVDQTLGNISFKYVNFSAVGTSIINLVEPSFKKGNAQFLGLQDFGKITGGSIVDYQSTFSGDITEAGAKKCSFCALDKDKNILGIFDSNGNPSTGFVNGSTIDNTKLMQIDTYVICLGAESENDYPTWISKIDFSYKAEIGYGGTFGSAEYRSQPNVVDSTVFNLYYEVDSGKRFHLYVKFEGTDSEGEGTSGIYYITFEATAVTKLKLFLYDTANFTLKVTAKLNDGTVWDEQEISATQTIVDIAATTWD